MPSTNKTSTGLNQWISSDKPKMTDFNADNIIIDGKIKLIQSDGDGTKYLADDGGYKAVSSGTIDYADLENKPMINGITLYGDKTAEALNLADFEHTHTQADITDFPTLATVAITNDYNDLDNKPMLAEFLTAENITAGVNVSVSVVGENVVISSTGGGGGGGVSPIATVSKVDTTATITITDINGTTTATVQDGLKGDKGDKGDKGTDGANGIDGAKGYNGSDGKSAYQSAVDGGFTGTELDFNASIASIGDISAVLNAINGEVI